MLDPTPRDRELAIAALELLEARGVDVPLHFGDWLEGTFASRCQEGREEGRRQYGFQEGQRVGLEAAIRELKRLTNDLEERARPLRRLLNQPAPPGEKE